jgi:hypothetical protein
MFILLQDEETLINVNTIYSTEYRWENERGYDSHHIILHLNNNRNPEGNFFVTHEFATKEEAMDFLKHLSTLS